MPQGVYSAWAEASGPAHSKRWLGHTSQLLRRLQHLDRVRNENIRRNLPDSIRATHPGQRIPPPTLLRRLPRLSCDLVLPPDLAENSASTEHDEYVYVERACQTSSRLGCR